MILELLSKWQGKKYKWRNISVMHKIGKSGFLVFTLSPGAVSLRPCIGLTGNGWLSWQVLRFI